MHHTDSRAGNHFARLFSYAPRPTKAKGGKTSRHRNALEDFCTEALAWCLISSRPFANRIFALGCFAAFGFQPESFQVDTQQSFTNTSDDEDETDIPNRSRFDLVLTSTAPCSFLVVIESKVAPDKREDIEKQIATYRHHANGPAFASYAKKLVVLLTPYADKHNADSHLSWDQIYDALHATVAANSEPQAAVMEQFADFLKLRHLAKMKLPPSVGLLPALKAAAPLLVGLDAIFESLRNDDVVKTMFKRGDVIPKMDVNTDNDEDYLWYGIWSRGARPVYLVGFHTTCSGNEPLSVSVNVILDGDRTSETLPEHLKEWFNKEDSGKEGDHTTFIFTTKLSSSFDGNAAAIEGWIIARLRETKEWADSL